MVEKPSNRDVMRRHWGDAAPEWVIVLAEACDSANQKVIGDRLNVSGSFVSQVLSNTYTGRLDRIEQRGRGELMNETRICPVLRKITPRRCIDAQTRRHATTNQLRIELRRACPRCPHQLKKEGQGTSAPRSRTTWPGGSATPTGRPSPSTTWTTCRLRTWRAASRGSWSCARR